MRFGKEFIEQVRNGNPIADVVGGYVTFQKKQGNKYWACCPFHDEKTPSFTVSPDRGLFYCFGCHEGGDVFGFIQKYENCGFTEAVEKLAQRAGIALPEAELGPEERKREARRKRLYEICDLAASYYHNCLLKTRMGAVGLRYWHERGLQEPAIIAFRLGYAPPEWDRLCRDFLARGFTRRELLASGLANEKNGKLYDRFRGRCIFPIRDARGRTVAFGGRILGAGEPKYLNSPETEIFHKGSLLYGWERALQAIRKEEIAVLVEGYMDVVGVHNQGVHNVVASLGTAFTVEQAQLLRRSAKEAVIAYDMDRAGREATDRVIEIARKTGLRVRIATLPNGKDPDEYIRTHGAKAWEDRIRAAQDVLTYRLEQTIRANDITTAEGKSAVLREVLPLVLAVENAVAVDSYLKTIAKRLRLDEGLVRSEAARRAQQERRDVYIAPARQTAEEKEDGEERRRRRMEEEAIRYALTGGPERDELLAGLEPEDFGDDFGQTLWKQLQTAGVPSEITPDLGRAWGLAAADQARLAGLLLRSEAPPGQVRETYIKPLRHARLQHTYDTLREEAAAAHARGDDAGYREAMTRVMAVLAEMKQWT